MAGKRQIEARWGVCFWDLVADFADQGLPRSDVAKALGYSRAGFYELLWDNPDRDPFESANIVAAYVRDSGETLRQAVTRMAKQGYTGRKAAETIGYYDWWGLKRALDARGISVEFKAKPRRKPPPVGPDVSRGWPTWKQIDRMTKSKPTTSEQPP
jgi:hypothetical protein